MAIYLACRRGASTDVLCYLAEQDMTTLFNVDSGGSLPVHAACSAAGVTVDKIKLLVEKGGVETLQLRDINCATPLHILCASNPSVDAVEYLAKVRPESVQEMTKDGDLPVIVAWKSSASESVIYALLRKYPLSIIDIAKHSGTTITGCPSARAAAMPPLSDPQHETTSQQQQQQQRKNKIVGMLDSLTEDELEQAEKSIAELLAQRMEDGLE